MSRPVALITGAGRRLGAAITKALHAQGYYTLLHYHQSLEAAEELAEQLNHQEENSAYCINANLTRVEDIEDLANSAVEQWGRLDVLVNSASSFYPTPLGTVNEAMWDDLIGTNLKAPFFLAQALAEDLAEGEGCIINIADIFAQRPMYKHTLYSVAKAGNIMLTQSLAQELAPEVRVNGIAPGAILWPENEYGELIPNQEILEKIPLARLGGEDSIAETVLFLVTQADYITGQIITVDGGRSLNQ